VTVLRQASTWAVARSASDSPRHAVGAANSSGRRASSGGTGAATVRAGDSGRGAEEWLGVLTRASCYGSSRKLACNHANNARIGVCRLNPAWQRHQLACEDRDTRLRACLERGRRHTIRYRIPITLVQSCIRTRSAYDDSDTRRQLHLP
jgi:hypothetical protein